MSEEFNAHTVWAILESLGIYLNENAIEYMMDTDCYYEARKRLIEIIVLRKSKFKKIDNGCWLVKEVGGERGN